MVSAPQAKANLLMAGGSLPGHPNEAAICEAFNKAAEDVCNNGFQGRKFTDVFYQKLRGIDQSLAQTTAREAGLIFRSGRFVGFASEIAQNASRFPVAGPIAVGMMQAVGNVLGGLGYAPGTAPTGWLAAPGAGGVDATRWGQLQSTFGTAPGNYSTRFLDGRLPDGRVLELKGPGDGYKDPGEAADQVKAGQGQPPVVASCQSCKSPHCSQAKTSKDGVLTFACT